MSYFKINNVLRIGAFLLFLVPTLASRAQEPVRYEGATILSFEPGSRRVVRLDFRIDPGYYIQANSVSEPNLIPTTLELEGDGFAVVGVRFPDGQSQPQLPDGKTYEASFSVEVVLCLARAHSEETQLTGTLHYQACTGLKCLFPKEEVFKVTLESKIAQLENDKKVLFDLTVIPAIRVE